MASSVVPTRQGALEWWLLAASIVTAAALLVAPVVIVPGVGLIVWAAMRLARGRSRRPGPLIAAIAVLSLAILVAAVVGVATFATQSTDDSGVTLIQG